jgi:hypothetical protein
MTHGAAERDLSMSRAPRAEAASASGEHVASIDQIPVDELGGAGRAMLRTMAEVGRNVYAYGSVGAWNVWLETEHITLEEWQTWFDVLCELQRSASTAAVATDEIRVSQSRRVTLSESIQGAYEGVNAGIAMSAEQLAALDEAAKLWSRMKMLRWCLAEVYGPAWLARDDETAEEAAVS